MSYPGSIDSFTPKVDDTDDVLAAHVNKLQVATAAIETELGTDPAGSQTDVKTRLAHLMSAAGYLEFDQETLLTISSGAVTVTQNLHRIETEAGAASDYLDTINGHSNGLFLIVRASNDAHTVVIRHNQGNILCTGGANISLDSTDELAWGYYDGTLSKWILMRGLSGEALTGAGTDNQIAVFTGTATQDSSDKLTFDGTTLAIGALTETTRQIFVDGASNEVQLKIQGHSTQTAHLFDFQDSGGNNVFYGTAAGVIGLNNPSTSSYPAMSFYGFSTTGWQGPTFQSTRKNGSGAVQNADVLFTIKASGWDGSAYGESAAILMFAQGNASAGSTPGEIGFKVTPNGSTSSAYTLSLYRDKRAYFYGDVGIGKSVPSGKCHIKGDSDNQVLIVQANATQTVNIMEVQDSAGNADVFVINRYERMGVGESNPGAMIHAWQHSSTGNCPVLILMQSDVDKEIVYYVGTAASADLTRSLVDEGDQSTTTLAGWVKVYIQDDGSQITNGAYFMPFYTLA